MTDNDDDHWFLWPWIVAALCCLYWKNIPARIAMFALAYLPLVIIFYIVLGIGKLCEGFKH